MHSIHTRGLIVGLILAGAATCLAGPPPATGAGAAAGGEFTPVDKSLSPLDYVKKGVPAHDRTWSGSDTAQAANAFKALVKSGAGQLPRYGSERSGVVFARLTGADNLEMYRDAGLPLNSRFQQALTQLQAGNEIYKLYIDALLKRATGDSELIEMTGSMLRTVRVIFDLVDEFLPTISRADPGYAKRMAGLEQMRAGFARMVSGSLETLTERQTARASERIKLIGYLKDTLPQLLPKLSESARAETLIRITQMERSPELAELQPSLGELAHLIRTVVEPQKIELPSASPSAAPAASPSASPAAGASPSPAPER